METFAAELSTATAKTESGDSYFDTRFAHDAKREIVWRALIQYHFQALVRPDHCVLELGSAYGHFINNIRAARRVALDQWSGFTEFMQAGVEPHVGDVSDLDFLSSRSVDFAFASNLFEHVSQEDFASVLRQLKSKLRPGGSIALLQPNYRYAYKEYFDDYTHRTVYSHTSLCDFLEANGYEVISCSPRFLPYSMKSSRFVSPLLIRLYLMSPWKFRGKQMLVHARPRMQGQPA
jgi:SAM-dependent methyltransferase